MLKLYSPIFPCNRNVIRKNINKKALENKNFELVKFNDGYGVFTQDEWYWVKDEEKEELKEKATRIFEGKFFDSFGWYALSPIELEIEVNRSCNLRCIHCWNESGLDKNVLEKNLIIELIEEFREGGGQRLLITGGEPLLYSNLEDILNFANKEKITRLELITNGTLIDKDTAKMLSRYLKYVNVSIYGHSGRIHDKITGVKNSFSRTIEGILNLKNYNVSSVLYFTVMEENFDSIPYMFQLAKELGIGAIRFNPVNPVGRAKNQRSMNLEGKILLSKYLQKLSKRTGIKLITSELNREEYEMRDSYKFYGCNALRTLVYITNKGEVLPCSLLSESVGNIYNQKLTRIWKGKKAHLFRQNLGCSTNCPETKNCGGLCKADFKNPVQQVNF